MYHLTFEQYDKMLEKFKNIQAELGHILFLDLGSEETKYSYWPTERQIETIKTQYAEAASQNESQTWLWFACYIHDMNPKPETDDEKKRKKLLLRFINENFEIV